MRFYLGTHEVSWLRRPDVMVPLFISRIRLDRQERLPRALANWALDSGGFSEILKHGAWTITPREYIDRIRRYQERIGRLDWAAPMDWMCEEPMLLKTGLSVREHQARTVANYAELNSMAPDLPIVPALQGQNIEDYLSCVHMYEDIGIDLTAFDLVGLGSVCRRQATSEIGEIVAALNEQGIKLHGFGCKAGAVLRYGHNLESADSMAWSYGGRKRGTCEHYKSRCANCLHWALDWRESVLSQLACDTL